MTAMAEPLDHLVVPLALAVLHSLWLTSLCVALFALVRPWLRTPTSAYAGALLSLLGCMAGFIGVFMASGRASPAALRLGPAPAVWLELVAAGWSIGALTCVARSGAGWLWLRWVVIEGSLPVTVEVERLFERLRVQAGVRPRVRVRASSRISSPMAAGLWAPVVLLPVSMLTGWPEPVLRAALVHELAHLRRGDHLAVVVQMVGHWLLFYHPAFRWLSAELRRLREYRCDQDSVRILGSKQLYVRALVAMEEARQSSLVPALTMQGGDLMTRVEHIFETPSGTRSRLPALATLAVLGAGAWIYVSALTPRAEASPPVPTELSIPWLPESITRWQTLISASAQTHQVPADVLALVMLIESRGRPEARSPAGAEGLMQVMPETALRIAEARGLDGFNPAHLSDPATNIDFGAWYLRQQFLTFAPSREAEGMLLAVSAYNAGPEAVGAVLRGQGELSAETRRYREIFRQLWSERARETSSLLPD